MIMNQQSSRPVCCAHTVFSQAHFSEKCAL